MKRTVRVMFLVALLVGGSLETVQPALAGCNVNVTFVKDSKEATVHLSDSKVKVKNGTYKKLETTNVNVSANNDRQRSFALDLGCSFQRRYKFYVTESGEGSKTIYKPNPNGFTTNTNLTVNINTTVSGAATTTISSFPEGTNDAAPECQQGDVVCSQGDRSRSH